MPRLVDEAYDRVAAAGAERLAFTIAFALFEYALKEALPVGVVRGRAVANWRDFEGRWPALDAVATGLTRRAVRYLLQHPPQVQVPQAGRAVYDPQPLPGAGNVAVCEALRRVRNNLFHGGKQPYTAVDGRRVSAGLQIIQGYLELHPDLAAAFRRGMG